MYIRFFKRFLDFVLSLSAVIVLSPLLLALTVIGAAAMGGNPFFAQPRPGKKGSDGNERIFSLVKFRTMSNKRDSDGNLLPDSQRLTAYGKFLRKTSLDELPELFLIITGKMALVGPRPQLVRDMVFMTAEQRRRHNVLPGLTGFAQVNGRNNVTWEKKLAMDLEYIDSGITFKKDVLIIFKTVKKVFAGSDTVRNGTDSDIDFGDWLMSEGKVDKIGYEEKQREAKELISVSA